MADGFDELTRVDDAPDVTPKPSMDASIDIAALLKDALYDNGILKAHNRQLMDYIKELEAWALAAKE